MTVVTRGALFAISRQSGHSVRVAARDDPGIDRSAAAGDDMVASSTRRERSSRHASSNRRRRWRVVIASCLVALAVVATIGIVAGYVVQGSWIKHTATIDSQFCHQASSGDGSIFTACTLDVSFIDLDGRTRVARLTGVQQTRIHNNTVVIYLDRKSPATAINPETRIPLWVFVFFGVFAWAVLGGLAFLTLREPRQRRTGTTRSPSGL